MSYPTKLCIAGSDSGGYGCLRLIQRGTFVSLSPSLTKREGIFSVSVCALCKEKFYMSLCVASAKWNSICLYSLLLCDFCEEEFNVSLFNVAIWLLQRGIQCVAIQCCHVTSTKRNSMCRYSTLLCDFCQEEFKVAIKYVTVCAFCKEEFDMSMCAFSAKKIFMSLLVTCS